MINEGEFWRLDPIAKAESVSHDIDRLASRARAAGLSVTAFILALAAQEARKDCVSMVQTHRPSARRNTDADHTRANTHMGIKSSGFRS